MKKISFGSFPITELRSDDRKCLDRYLIKTFSDNISISDAIRNLSVTKDLMYITPDALMSGWLKGKDGFGQNEEKQNDRTSNSTYDKALKRAFFVLKEFYKKIKDAPFYKEFIYYPIYVEKIDKVHVSRNTNGDASYTEVQMNYSFVILSNDLTKSLKIDEIRYDDNASLNFLYLFVEFFSGPDFGRSIHDFNQKDYEFLVKLYQFIEQSGKDPIHMTITLYKLIGLIKSAVNGDSKRSVSYNTNKGIDEMDVGSLIKYKGVIHHQLIDLISKTSSRSGGVPAETYQKAFIDIMNAIFKSEGLSGLFDGVDTKADMGERYAYVYNTNKYREVLNLAKELVEYNKLDCKKVITNDPMDFDFKVEHGQYTVETQSHIIAQRYQTFFKSYIDSIGNHLEGIIQSLIEDLKIPEAIKLKASNDISSMQTSLDTLNTELNQAEAAVRNYKNMLSQDDKDIQHHKKHINNGSTPSDLQTSRRNYDNSARHLSQYQAVVINRNKDIKDMETIQKLTSDASSKIDKFMSDTTNTIYAEIKDSIISSIANDLTFIYDDGKRFFTNELVTKGFLDGIGDSKYDPTLSTGFDNIAKDSQNKNVFPPRKANGSKPTYAPKDNEESNPSFYMAQVVSALQDGFNVMSEDTMTALSDRLMPAIASVLKDNMNNKNLASKLGANKFFTGNSTAETITDDLLNDLMQTVQSDAAKNKSTMYNKTSTGLNKVYKERFISHVLINFKKMFRLKQINQALSFDEGVSELHPLIKKLVKNGDRCQFFKSFILSYEVAEHLYNTKYIVDTKKFLYGLSNTPPRKLSSPMNRLQEVLFNYLGLKNNPTWVISKSEVYLSMPDDLSLTNTSILSKIPKADLMEVCKIKASDYWNQNTMGKVAQFGNKKLKELESQLTTANHKLSDIRKSSGKGKDKSGAKEEQIRKAQKKIDDIENKMAKIKLEEKDFVPNAFLFNDDPNQAEKQDLLSDSEKAELQQNKDTIRDKLESLNPYDEEDLEQMQDNIDNQSQRTLPFDLEQNTPQVSKSDMAKQQVDDDNAAFEEFLKKQKAFEDYKTRGNKF